MSIATSPLGVIATFTAMVLATTPAPAGKVERITTTAQCIKSVSPGDPLLSAIPSPHLPATAIVRLCDGSAMRISRRSGKLLTKALRGKIPGASSVSNTTQSLPDTRVSMAKGNIRQAWLTHPTRRYGHGVLGDRIEAGGMAVKTAHAGQLEFVLDKKSVFEDRMARLIDLDHDGTPEIVAIRSYLDRGAALAVFGVRKNRLVHLAETAAIGTPNRWLNVAGAADFDGDGTIEIAWVETPHIGGILKVARLTGFPKRPKLKILSRLGGFSNHVIGSRDLFQSVTFDWDGDGLPDIILPGAARRTLNVVSMRNGKLRTIDSMSIGGQIASSLVAGDLNGDGIGAVMIALNDGRLMSFSPTR